MAPRFIESFPLGNQIQTSETTRDVFPSDTGAPIVPTAETTSCIYDFHVKDLNDDDVCLKRFEGKVVLIVNYASTCGFTIVNVNALSDLAKKYNSRGLAIILFPSNDFWQNFDGDSAGLKLANNHPEFVVFRQISVNGNKEHPLYTYLKRAQPGDIGSTIKWNFTKFLVNRSGQAVKRFSTGDLFEDLEKSVLDLLDAPY